MKKLLVLFLLFSFSAHSLDLKDRKVTAVGYYSKIYGHVHKNPFRYSLGLTTISCGHPMKILKARESKEDSYQDIFGGIWRFVKVGPYHGYIHMDYISSTKPKCFQDKYPKFFEHFDLEISDMYYWGKLYDQYLTGKSKVQ